MTIRIALDAMGGDFAPAVPVAGAAEALSELPQTCRIVLVGREDEVRAAMAEAGVDAARIDVVDAPEVVTMSDKPLAAIRSKPRSSIRVGSICIRPVTWTRSFRLGTRAPSWPRPP